MQKGHDTWKLNVRSHRPSLLKKVHGEFMKLKWDLLGVQKNVWEICKQ